MEWKETKRNEETEERGKCNTTIIHTLFSLANVPGDSLASFLVRSDKREDPAYASCYTRGSLLYIFVQNGFGTIGDETEREAKSREI